MSIQYSTYQFELVMDLSVLEYIGDVFSFVLVDVFILEIQGAYL